MPKLNEKDFTGSVLKDLIQQVERLEERRKMAAVVDEEWDAWKVEAMASLKPVLVYLDAKISERVVAQANDSRNRAG